jgi:hypothetical protein
MPISTVSQKGLDAPLTLTTPTLTSPTLSGTTTATTVTSPAATALTLQSAGTTAITIDSSQRVGIGTTTPTTNLQVRGAGSGTFGAYNDPLNVKGSDYTLLYVNGTNGIAATIYDYNSSNGWYTGTNNSAGYRIGYMSSINQTGVTNAKDGSTGITVDTSSKLYVGTTSATNAATALRNVGAASGKYWQSGPDTNSHYIVYNQAGTGAYLLDGSTSWAGASDERLKTDLKPIENAAEKVATLRAVTGRFKTDEEDISRSFLIAQDVQAVLPEAVGESPDGHLGLSYTDVIPLLVAAIKELKAEIDVLKASK